MSKTYRYLTPRGKSLIYANTVNVQDQLAVASVVLTPKSIGVDIHRNSFTLNQPYTLPQPAGCEDGCNTKVVDLSVGLTLSGPISAKTQLLAMASQLIDAVNAGEFDEIFDGFPANQTDLFVIGQE